MGYQARQRKGRQTMPEASSRIMIFKNRKKNIFNFICSIVVRRVVSPEKFQSRVLVTGPFSAVRSLLGLRHEPRDPGTAGSIRTPAGGRKTRLHRGGSAPLAAIR